MIDQYKAGDHIENHLPLADRKIEMAQFQEILVTVLVGGLVVRDTKLFKVPGERTINGHHTTLAFHSGTGR